MDLGELDSGLHGEVRHGVRQSWPEALRLDQFRTGARRVGLVQRHPRGHGMHDASTTGVDIDANADPSLGTTEPGTELAGEASAPNTRSSIGSTASRASAT